MLAEARSLVLARPEVWKVHIGTQLMPKHKELYRRVKRGDMLALLDRWTTIVRRARESDRPVICFGD